MTTTVQSVVTDVTEAPVGYSTVTATLGGIVNGIFTPVSGWASSGQVVSSAQTISDRATGAWSLKLIANADITPANTVYQITQQADGKKLIAIVPDSSSPQELSQIVVSDPPSLDETAAQAALNAQAAAELSASQAQTSATNASTSATQAAASAAVIPPTSGAASGDAIVYNGTVAAWSKLTAEQVGAVAIINGQTPVDGAVTLDAAQVGAVATSEVGAAGGVASLDDNELLPVAQVPDLSGTYLPTAQAGLLAATYGVKADGITDDSAAMNSALAAATTARVPLILPPNAVVLIGGASLTPPSNTTLDLNGSTLKSALPGVNDSVILITGQSNVLIKNGAIDGDLSSFGDVTEHRHGIKIVASQNVTVRDVTSTNNKGDGIYIGDQTSGASSNVNLVRAVCTENYRNNLTISHVDGFKATASSFTDASGTSPQAGIDIEPNVDGVVCRKITFTDCDITGNAAGGLIISLRAAPTVEQQGIELIGCSIDDNLSNGLQLSNARGVKIVGGSINGNTNYGVWLSSSSGTSENVTFSATEIAKNGSTGIRADTAFTNLTLAALSVRDNSQTTSGAQMGIDLLPAAASTGLTIAGCTSTGVTQHGGLRTNNVVSNVVMAGNDFRGNGSYQVSLADDVTTRVRIDTSGTDIPTAVGFVNKSTYTAASGSTMIGLRANGQTVDQVALRTDGVVTFSSGTAAQDTQLSRVVAGVLGVGPTQCLRTGVAATGSRPSASAVGAGSQFFDSTLGKPIWSNGTAWVDATGATQS